MNTPTTTGLKGRESGMPDASYWETFFNPTCILERLGCSGSCGNVVEFGCGYGTFTLPAAQLLDGTIVAFDIELELVQATIQKADELGRRNVVVQERDIVGSGTGLAEGSMGYALLFNILHIENPLGLLEEAKRVLVPGGKVGIIHWRNDIPTPRGPSFDIRPTPEQCRVWAEEVGLEFVRYEELCCCSWHWGLVMRRPAFSLLTPAP